MVSALRKEVARLCCQEPQVVLVATAPDRTTLTGKQCSFCIFINNVSGDNDEGVHESSSMSAVIGGAE